LARLRVREKPYKILKDPKKALARLRISEKTEKSEKNTFFRVLEAVWGSKTGFLRKTLANRGIQNFSWR